MKRVLILSSYPLFSEGVASLLGQKAGIELLGQESDVNRAVEQIRLLHPDVIIVDAGSTHCDASPIAQVLEANCNGRVIGLNLNDNTIAVYHEEHRPIRGVEDLMHAIESDDNAQTIRKGDEQSSTTQS